MCTGNQPHGFPLRTELFCKQRPGPWPRHKTSNCRSRSRPPAERRIPASAEPPIQPVPSGGKRPARAAARHTVPPKEDAKGFAPHFRVQKDGSIGNRRRICLQPNHVHVLRYRFRLFCFRPGMAGTDHNTVKAGGTAQFFRKKSSPFPNGKEVVKSKSCLMSASLFSRCRPPGLSHPRGRIRR